MYLKSRILSIIIVFAVHVIHAVSESCGFVTIAIFNWSLLMFFFCSNLLGLYLSFSLFICSQQPSLSVHDNQVYHSGHCDHPLLHVRGQCLHVITSYWKMKIIGRKWILALKKCKFFGFCILKMHFFWYCRFCLRRCFWWGRSRHCLSAPTILYTSGDLDGH